MIGGERKEVRGMIERRKEMREEKVRSKEGVNTHIYIYKKKY